jgi:hypothetical protein
VEDGRGKRQRDEQPDRRAERGERHGRKVSCEPRVAKEKAETKAACRQEARPTFRPSFRRRSSRVRAVARPPNPLHCDLQAPDLTSPTAAPERWWAMLARPAMRCAGHRLLISGPAPDGVVPTKMTVMPISGVLAAERAPQPAMLSLVVRTAADPAPMVPQQAPASPHGFIMT